MQPLQPPESHFLLAALGWVELGNPAEAEAELNSLPAKRQTHPDVLEVRWLVYVEQKCWEKGLEVARQLLQAAPERSSGWLHQAYALRRVPGGGLDKAWEALLPAAERFPQEPTIPYNLSCYACQLHQLDAARTWLKRAAAISGKEPIQKMALADPDLEPLWAEIREL